MSIAQWKMFDPPGRNLVPASEPASSTINCEIAVLSFSQAGLSTLTEVWLMLLSRKKSAFRLEGATSDGPVSLHDRQVHYTRHTIILPRNGSMLFACGSSIALVTIVDHLGKAHLIESNALVSATRSTHLSPRHPFRVFAKIFTYR